MNGGEKRRTCDDHHQEGEKGWGNGITGEEGEEKGVADEIRRNFSGENMANPSSGLIITLCVLTCFIGLASTHFGICTHRLQAEREINRLFLRPPFAWLAVRCILSNSRGAMCVYVRLFAALVARHKHTRD